MVAIVGMGFLGALLTQLVKEQGATVLAISRRPLALELAERMGADQCFSLDGRVVQQVEQLTRGALCPCVIETTGLAEPLTLAAELVQIRGRLVIAGYHQDGARTVNMQLWNWRGLDVINAHERDPQIYFQAMCEAVTRMARGKLDPAPLLTHHFPLQRLGDALDAAARREGSFLKAIVWNS